MFVSFHILDLEQNTVETKTIPETFESFIRDSIEYASHNEKNKAYCIRDEQTLVVNCVKQMVVDHSRFLDLTNSIANKLLECERMAQAKIYRMGLHVKKGSLIQTLVDKGNDCFDFVICKVENSEWYDGKDLSVRAGFSKDKKSVWKSVVFSCSLIDDQVYFESIDVYCDTQAKYWTVSFLELEEKRDDLKNTYDVFKAIDRELKNTIEEFSPNDYVQLSSSLQNTMNTPQEMNYVDYVDRLIDDYQPSDENIEKDIIKDCLMALPERKKFDTHFKVEPSALNNKQTKKFRLSDGIELTIKSNALDYPAKIVSTIVDGKRVIQIECEDEDSYNAFA